MGDAGAELSQDLFCLSCAYNLRGLSGDPIRCPECGTENPVELVQASAPLVLAHIRQTEDALVTATLFLFVLLPAPLLTALLPIFTGRRSGCELGFLALMVFLSLLWWLRIRVYALLTEGAPQRVATAVWYQLGCLTIAYLFLALLLVPVLTLTPWVGVKSVGRWLLSATGFVVGAIVARPITRWYTSWMRTLLAPLKREVALGAVAQFLVSRERQQYVNRAAAFMRNGVEEN